MLASYCACVETIVRYLVLVAGSQEHSAHKSLLKIVHALLQVRSAPGGWQRVAMHCLCVLSWGFPKIVIGEVKEWTELSVARWPFPENEVCVII